MRRNRFVPQLLSWVISGLGFSFSTLSKAGIIVIILIYVLLEGVRVWDTVERAELSHGQWRGPL